MSKRILKIKQEETGEKERITISLERDLVAQLDVVCAKAKCSRSWLIAQVIENADLNALLTEYDKKSD